MSPNRRLLVFAVMFAATATVACAPLNRARTGLAAATDSLTSTRDSLRLSRDSMRVVEAELRATRSSLLSLDSVFVPLDFTTPDSFLVAFETTKGRFEAMAHRNWAPIATERFYELVHRRFYDSVFFHRVVKGFVAQFGMNGAPGVIGAWRNRRLIDDSVRQGNARTRIAFARSGANTRTTQLFINLANNPRLDTAGTIGFPAFAEVVRGMEVVDSLNSEYGSAPNRAEDSLARGGNAYFLRAFPNLDMIRTARIIQEWRRPRR